MKLLILALLLVGCSPLGGGKQIQETLLTKAVNSPAITGVDNPVFFSLLPWAIVLCGLCACVFALYTPSKRDDLPGLLIFGASIAFAMAIARNGVGMSMVVERVCYGLGVVSALYFGRGWYLREKETKRTNLQ
tara:strand:- start:73 stop:471 length:399 start_codon:yes stop_codon:yes gene_type:complete